MAKAHDSSDRNQVQSNGLISIRRPFCCGIQLRRRKIPVARLGGKKRRRALVVWRMLGRMRMRWLKLHYFCLLKKLKDLYKSFMKDMVEAGTSVEAFHQRLLMETSFAIPIMGVSLSNYPSVYRSYPPLSLYN